MNPEQPNPDPPGEPSRPGHAARRYLLRVWTDGEGFCATVQGGGEPAVTFREPDDVLLFLYRRLLRPGLPPP